MLPSAAMPNTSLRLLSASNTRRTARAIRCRSVPAGRRHTMETLVAGSCGRKLAASTSRRCAGVAGKVRTQLA